MNMIYIDTETTGTTDTDEILSIAIVDDEGTILLDTYLTPDSIREWPRAQERNRITPEFIFNGGFPTAADIEEQVRKIISKDDIVCYNADFDLPFIERVWYPEGLRDEFCCMLAFAIYRGEPSTKAHHKAGFRTWKLAEAAEYTGFHWQGKPHGALADALACRHVWLWLDMADRMQESA